MIKVNVDKLIRGEVNDEANDGYRTPRRARRARRWPPPARFDRGGQSVSATL